MKNWYLFALLALCLFEVANVYFIMPMPGSQQMETIGIAYFLYQFRWVFRLGLGALALLALWRCQMVLPWYAWLLTLAWAGVTCLFNFNMSADSMFLQPDLVMRPASDNQIDSSRIVLGIHIGDAARAYPIQLLAYHHQVRDTLAGMPVMVTYCNVCRSGRVFEPRVNGVNETFRLVGMDHFNAMFEDSKTHSWWRQENGEAIAGPLRGQKLNDLPVQQMTLRQWLQLYPASLIMQPDPDFKAEYEQQTAFETGKKRGKLTGTDTLSWAEKSWVVGVEAGGETKAFDWNELKKKRVINAQVGTAPVVLYLAPDTVSFAVFERPYGVDFTLRGDTLYAGQVAYDLAGKPSDARVAGLKKLPAYQEFWHSWRYFQIVE